MGLFCRAPVQRAINRTVELIREDAEIIFIAISVLALRISTWSKGWSVMNCRLFAACLADICE
jgi:hypothetical protein